MATSGYHFFRPKGVLRAVGPDARSFLQGQFSNDLSRAKPGDCVYGLWLDRKGKIEADSFVLCESADSFLLLSYFCPSATIESRLDRFLIMDEVELVDQSSGAGGLTLWGQCADEALELLGCSRPPNGRWTESSGFVVFEGRRGEEACLEVISLPREVDCIQKLETIAKGLSGIELDEAAMAHLSVEGLVPRIGLEFGSVDLPQELGLEIDAVSFNKGCYLGQEVMARIHSMGLVRKRIRKVCIEGKNTEFLPPMDLFDEAGKKQGVLRSMANVGGAMSGIAIINTSFKGNDLKAGALIVRIVESNDG